MPPVTELLMAQQHKKSDYPVVEDEFDVEESSSYRSTSKAAIAAAVVTLFSLTAYLSVTLSFLPVLAVVLGWIALRNIRTYPDELRGYHLARATIFGGGFILLSSIALHAYTYATEVPEGHQRINFRMLRNDPRTTLPYAEIAEQLDGQKVFIKGWVRPGDRRTGLKQFILVGDFGSCCFGGNPDITEVIGINIVNDQTVDYSLRLRSIAGTFRLNPRAARTGESEVPRVFYQIEADHIR